MGTCRRTSRENGVSPSSARRSRFHANLVKPDFTGAWVLTARIVAPASVDLAYFNDEVRIVIRGNKTGQRKIKRWVAVVAMASGLACQALAQTPATFEAASIRRNLTGSQNTQINISGGRFTATNYSLKTLIRNAYDTRCAFPGRNFLQNCRHGRKSRPICTRLSYGEAQLHLFRECYIEPEATGPFASSAGLASRNPHVGRAVEPPRTVRHACNTDSDTWDLLLTQFLHPR